MSLRIRRIARRIARPTAIAAVLAGFLGGASAHADGAGVPRVAPYLQSVGSDRAAVRFELASPARAKVELVGPSGPARTVASDVTSAMHVVPLDGLQPGARYRYVVRVDGAAIGEGTFTTAPADDRPFSFLVYGDSRTDPLTHAAIVRGMLRAPGDFLIHTGDLTQRGGSEAREWLDFFAAEKRLLADRCVFAVVGNHELYGDARTGAVTFLRYFATGATTGQPHLYDTMRWGNTRFFLLDAMDDWSGPEREWLKGALTAADHEPGLVHRIAVAHAGPWSSGPHDGNPAMRAARIPELLREHRVDLVISGHDHIYERGEANGLKYLVSGGAGAPLYEPERRLPTTQRLEAVHHWSEIAIDGPRLALVTRRLDGSTLETCSYSLGEPWSCEGAVPAAAVARAPAAAPPAPAPPPPAPPSRCACSAPGRRAAAPGAALAMVALGAALLRRRARR